MLQVDCAPGVLAVSARLGADQGDVVMLGAEGQENPLRPTRRHLHAQHVFVPGRAGIRVLHEEGDVGAADARHDAGRGEEISAGEGCGVCELGVGAHHQHLRRWTAHAP